MSILKLLPGTLHSIPEPFTEASLRPADCHYNQVITTSTQPLAPPMPPPPIINSRAATDNDTHASICYTNALHNNVNTTYKKQILVHNITITYM